MIYKNTAKIAKKIGLINWDLRRKLSPQQKSRLSTIYKEYAYELKNPTKIKILKVTKSQAGKLKDKNIIVKKGRHAIINVRKDETVKITRNELIIKNKKRGKETRLSFKKGAALLLELEKRIINNDKTNDLITVRLSNQQVFAVHFLTYQDLLNYLQTLVFHHTPKRDQNKLKNELFEDMQIVRFAEKKTKKKTKKR